ncbi:WecB/TagA/CpsF family glycosyltransferase, partial [Enterococcus faecalis]|uniref:WecB/TagA/CpsF family glycosyltransferase n=1 Tax=Enterococcus faecalis TaxID=1351 RepID=UPI003D6B9F4A
LHGYTKKKQQEIVEQINKAEARFVFVALGSPKQEIFLEQTIDHLRANVFLDVGGTFDVLAGSVKSAPEFYINHNLEWLY